jgi:arginine utilization protein RocB
MRWHAAQRVYDLMLHLAKIPSISGTTQELNMANAIVELLLSIPYFQEHRASVVKHPVAQDKLGRSVVTALFKGRNNPQKTVVLLSHYDVVGIEGFGRFQSDAFDPEKYTERLRRECMDLLDENVRIDLESGNWLFGRGVMDMKAGLAMQMDVLRYFSEMKDFDGNLLLLATPDEETSSVGMLEAVSILNQLKTQQGIKYEVCICSEANWSAYPGDDARYIYTGSVGKLLPVICGIGVETHAGEPLLGVNAGWMVSEIVSQMELAPALMDELDGEIGPPPTCLDMRVVKDSYNVQTPSFAYAMYNVLTLQRSPQEVLNVLKELANHVSDAIYQRMVDRYATMDDGVQKSIRTDRLRPKVYSYHELYQLGIERYGDQFVSDIDEIIRKAEDSSTDSRQATVLLAQCVSSYFIEEAPFYLLVFAPPYYPHVYLDESNSLERSIQEVANQVYQDALEEDAHVRMKRFFPGLSDVSYCRIHDADKVLSTLKRDMPTLNRLYHVPVNEIIKLNLPTLNIGPYGKDAHKRTERLELSYSTEVAPQLLANSIRYVLQGVPPHHS